MKQYYVRCVWCAGAMYDDHNPVCKRCKLKAGYNDDILMWISDIGVIGYTRSRQELIDDGEIPF